MGRKGGKDLEQEGSDDDREQWGSQLEFILTCVGYAVGLGNVWRFPYLCYKNGGGAFLIPYVIMLAFCGMALFFFEVCFGQFASLGPLSIWVVNPMWKGIGMAMVTVSMFVGLYYNILVAYITYYLFASMTTYLPWSDCENAWNNATTCRTADDMANKTALSLYLAENGLTNEDIETPSEQYFYNQVLQISDGFENLGSLVPLLVACVFVAWLIVFLVLIKGISSLGKVVYFTSTFPYIMMTIMVIRGCLLEGAGQGLEYYFKPDFSKLGNAEVWSDAAVQIFYSLSTCSGGLVAMASYNKFDNKAGRDGLLIPLINCGTSIYAGLAVFSVLGFLAQSKGVDVDDVAASGPGLVFVVYPEGLSQMPAAPVWSILFFFMMITLGFSSQFSIVECIYTALLDQFPHIFKRNKWGPILLRGVGCLCFFLLSLPMVCEGGFYWFSVMDSYAGGLPRLFIGIFELIAVTWIYGLGRFMEDVQMMLGSKPNWYYRACWVVLTPAIVIAIVGAKIAQNSPLTLGDYTYPQIAGIIGWCMVLAVIIWIPVGFIIQPIRMFGALNWENIKKASQPTDEWGPALAKNRTGKYAPTAEELAVTAPPGGRFSVIEPHLYTVSKDVSKDVSNAVVSEGEVNPAFKE